MSANKNVKLITGNNSREISQKWFKALVESATVYKSHGITRTRPHCWAKDLQHQWVDTEKLLLISASKLGEQPYLVVLVLVGDQERVHRSNHGLNRREDVLVHQFRETLLVLLGVAGTVNNSHLLDKGALPALSSPCTTKLSDTDIITKYK